MAQIRVPTLGESVTEATIGKWFKKPGDAVAFRVLRGGNNGTGRGQQEWQPIFLAGTLPANPQ